jgi:hypothetical protein
MPRFPSSRWPAGSLAASNLGRDRLACRLHSMVVAQRKDYYMLKLDGAQLSRGRIRLCVFLLAGGLLLAEASTQVQPLGIERLPDGNTLIADAGAGGLPLDGRVLEVDSLGRLVWAYLKGDVPFVHTARRLPNGNTLMSATGGDRVVEVNRDGDTVWTMATGLAYPNEAYRLANCNTLITDRDNNQVIEVTPQRMVVWGYTILADPHNASRLANGHTLICDKDPDRVVEVDAAGTLVWQFATGLSWPRCAQRLPGGNTLIADSRHNRVIEVDASGAIVWSADGLAMPYQAVRLANGNTLVSTGEHVLELTPLNDIAWQYPNTVEVVVETLQVVNPSSGCSLYVHIHRPAYAGPSRRVPGVVFAPGGTTYGSAFDMTGLPDDIASDGFAFLHFDPDGRGRSGVYPENYCGHVQQDGMHACLSELASRGYVDTGRLGVYTQSYGITMGSGMIARYDEPRVKFMLDFEGPADRYQTCLDSGGFVPAPPDSDEFWREREAARFMKHVPGAYLRMQPQIDSNPRLGDNRHAIQLIDSATAVACGGSGISSWTRVNDSLMNPVNRVYTRLNPPAWIPDEQERQNRARVLLYLHELADVNLPVAVDVGRVIRPTGSLRVAPRPCRGALRVAQLPGTRPCEILVHDACGRRVATANVPVGRTQALLDLRGLQPGVYYVTAAGAGTVPVVVVR